MVKPLWSPLLPSSITLRTGSVGDGSGTQGFAGAGGTEKQNALGRVDAQIDETFGMQKRDLHHFAQLLNLLFAAADVGVGHVGFFLHLA